MFVNSRTENVSPEQEDLIEGLSRVGFEVEVTPGTREIALRSGRTKLLIDFKAAAAPSAATVDQLIAGRKRSDRTNRVHILIANRLSAASRSRLREEGWGWLDRRGHVRLWAPREGIQVETEIRPLRVEGGLNDKDPLGTRVGLEVASALLLHPKGVLTVRALARKLGRAPSAVSTTLKRLHEASLVTRELQPLIPELFEELSDHWAPRRIPLAAAPGPGDARSLERLQFNIDDPETSGWSLTDTLAASYYGAPVVVGTGYPPDFYVPSEIVLRDAVNHFGLAPTYEVRACSVSVAHVKAATAPRFDAATEFLLAHPLFVALELARDRARGREVLNEWDPPEEFSRVW